MINQNFLSKLFELYLEKEQDLHASYDAKQPISCYTKYKKSLPNDYIFKLPHTVILKLTETCNLRCKHCFYAEQPEYYNKCSELSTHEIKQLIDFLTDEINIISITLTGGEVFVRQDFLLILEYIKSKNLIVTVQTNGVLIDECKAQRLGQLLNPKIDFVQISLDGADELSHDAIRGNGTFAKTINAIRLLRRNDVKVQINTTLTTVSAPKMEQMFELCNDLNVNLLSISRYEVCSEKQQYLNLSPEELIKYSYIILKKAQAFKNLKMKYKPLSVFDFLKIPECKVLLDNYIIDHDIKIPKFRCLSCNRHDKLTISSEGNIFFCSMDESEGAILGNLRKEDFYEIWENRFNTPYFQKRDMTTTKCKNCKYVALCNTGCMASAYKKYKDINAAPAECSYYEIYLKEYYE